MIQSNRNLVFILLVIGLLAGVSGASAVLSQRQMRLRGAINGLPAPDMPFRVPVSGVNVELQQYDQSDLDGQLDLMGEAGLVWLRQTFPWGEIEPQRGQYDWAKWDAIVETVASHPADLRLVAVLTDSPAWAADVPGLHPREAADFHNFARAFAERYGAQIDAYQIWDEPNLSSGWGGPVDPIGYSELLRGSFVAIHLSDPDTAIVLTGALAPTTESSLDALAEHLFLRAVYEAGGRFYYDGIAIKAYGSESGLSDLRVNAKVLNYNRIVLLREEMEANDDMAKAVWVTSFAFDTPPEQQAAWTTEALRRAAYEWPWAGALIVDEWQPAAPPDDVRWQRALRDTAGEARPVYDALREVAPGLLSEAHPGKYHASNLLIDYYGQWITSPLGTNMRLPGYTGYVTLPFYGSEVALITRRPGNSTYIYVKLNGEPSPSLPRSPRGAFLVVTSANLQPAFDTQMLASGLNPEERNVIRLEHERTWVPWLLIGFSVGNHIPTLNYDLAIAGLALLAIGAAWGARRVGREIEFGVWGQSWRRGYDWLGNSGQHVLTVLAGLAVWVGLTMTWGGTLSSITRRLGDGPSLALTVLSAGVFYFSPWLILTMLALVILFVLIYLRLELGLALVVLFAPFYLLPRPVFDRFFSLVEVVLLLVFAAWALRQVASWRERLPPGPRALWNSMNAIDRAALLFVVMGLFTPLVADVKGVAFTELRTIVLEPALLYLVIRTSSLSRSDVWRLVDVWVLAGVAVSLIGLYEYITGIDIVFAEEGVERLRSVYGSPNNVGLYLGRIVPITLAVTMSGDSRLRRVAYAVSGGLMLVAVVLSLSKGALLLGLPAGLALVVLMLGGRWGRVAVLGGAIAGAIALIPLSQHPRFSDLFQLSTGTTGFRLMLWRSSLSMLRDRPLLGFGLDNFLYAYRGHYIVPAAWFEPNLSHPHNVVLDYWLRLGIVGLIAGIWLQLAFWRKAWRAQTLCGYSAWQRPGAGRNGGRLDGQHGRLSGTRLGRCFVLYYRLSVYVLPDAGVIVSCFKASR